MEAILLATKLQIPPRTRHVVHRARLVDALERDIPDYRLALLAAPAGYGKTTLLAQWARASRLPVAWLSLTEEENDPERFLRYLLAAWERIYPDIRDSPAWMLLGSMMPDRDAALAEFINIANLMPDHAALVLDDYHLISDDDTHAALTFLLDHLPPTLHVVLAGRGEPTLPLSRYRARDELLELRAEELQFEIDEAEAFLNEQMGLALAEGEVASLREQMEGWIAGLQMASLTLRHHREPVEQHVVTGRHRFIADYLSDDVLVHLTDEVQQFLLQTSLLDRLSASLCDAVTGRDDGQQMLELLERENLFLMPLDDSRQWYRYHRLFADFLRAELGRRQPAEAVPLHRRAAGWYLERDAPEQAFPHAVAGDDLELVTRIFERYSNIKLNSGELRLVAQWLDATPAAWQAARPAIGLSRAGLLAYTGAFEACVQCVNDIEQQLTSRETGETGWQMAMVSSIRCFIACIQNDIEQAEAHAGRALRDLREEGVSFRATIYQALGDTYRRNGRWEEAREHYLRVLTFPEAPSFSIQSAHVFGALADLALRQGRLRDAADYWRRALAAIQEPESWGRVPLPAIGWVLIRMSELLYEWNELPEAWDHLSRGLERSELGGDVRAMIAGRLVAVRLKLAEGDVEAASGYLEQARPLVEQAPFPEWVGRFERLQLELWLAQDHLRAAVIWCDEALAGNLATPPEPETAQLSVARALIVKGDQQAIEQALELLEHLSRAAEVEGKAGVTIEALALDGLARWRRGERADALTCLEHAVRLAEPEGYVRLFADLGLPMVRLLQEARSRNVMPEYVAMLLAACGPATALPDHAQRSLPEPLTAREQEILELLAAGLTNREIAERLFVSPETIKKHTGNIYGKLGVRGRTEAVARSRELHLLA
ncbi:MAG TPA: LuxR C-terminal-related transcriptional regulator [Thermomicrobiales bacterium]|nr:LuxR C-terminal-related transcriptional regulator [Thermomicrobiales bacterium]